MKRKFLYRIKVEELNDDTIYYIPQVKDYWYNRMVYYFTFPLSNLDDKNFIPIKSDWETIYNTTFDGYQKYKTYSGNGVQSSDKHEYYTSAKKLITKYRDFAEGKNKIEHNPKAVRRVIYYMFDKNLYFKINDGN